MTHLFVCREYPPAAYPPGGIGTYVRSMAHLLAKAGETVHVIGQRWHGAPDVREETLGGRLIVHRVALDDASADAWSAAIGRRDLVPRGLLASSFPSQAFAWQAAFLAESLVEHEGIDVIEAQEWEAPLYYFQMRRALGHGPAARPPCVVHIHSPSERIYAANGWDTNVVDYHSATTLEAISITAADAVLCPSQFVADEVMARYGIARSRVTVIPYPLGDVPHVDRTEDTWSAGSVCHVGRIEPRKGVLEWSDAVGMVADDAPPFTMEFIGGDTPLAATGGPTVGDTIRARMSPRVDRQFRFNGIRPRNELFGMLSKAWAVVVPSRWDNLPYTCIEAMATGLPIIASPNGGMRELIEDGTSGWIAADATPSGLAAALRRALHTSGADRARMGEAAERRVRDLCNSDRIITHHLEIKRRLRDVAASSPQAARSVATLPIGYVALQSARSTWPTSSERRGLGIYVTGGFDDRRLTSWSAAVQEQSEPPVVTQRAGVAGFGVPQQLLGVAFVDIDVSLEAGALATCCELLREHDNVGVISSWVYEDGAGACVLVPRSPLVPCVGHGDQISPFLVVRASACEDALTSISAPPGEMPRQVIESILAAGWGAITVPAVLGTVPSGWRRPSAGTDAPRYSSMARAVQRLHTPVWEWLISSPADERWAVIRDSLRSPAHTLRGLLARVVDGRRKAAMRTSSRGSDV